MKPSNRLPRKGETTRTTCDRKKTHIHRDNLSGIFGFDYCGQCTPHAGMYLELSMSGIFDGRSFDTSQEDEHLRDHAERVRATALSIKWLRGLAGCAVCLFFAVFVVGGLWL